MRSIISCWINIHNKSWWILCKIIRFLCWFLWFIVCGILRSHWCYICLWLREVTIIFPIFTIVRFCRDIEFMTGERPGLYWTFTWRFVAPVIMLILFVSCTVMTFIKSADYYAYNIELVSSHSHIHYNIWLQAKPQAEPYPVWCLFVAGLLVLSTILPVPFVFFVRYFRIWKFEGDIPLVCCGHTFGGKGREEGKEIACEQQGKMSLQLPIITTLDGVVVPPHARLSATGDQLMLHPPPRKLSLSMASLWIWCFCMFLYMVVVVHLKII